MDTYTFIHEEAPVEVDEAVYTNGGQVVSDYLPDVLKAFKDFLVASGFTYVTEVVVATDVSELTYSSFDADEVIEQD